MEWGELSESQEGVVSQKVGKERVSSVRRVVATASIMMNEY